ncbi:MAG: RlmE family RNA methyltransferase [Treponema sp.]|jgi:23S rRNA (uridine2552-2'-O)-methyltransferase|nr:RlmE family RNA methyltransferase [Treponema sp.]
MAQYEKPDRWSLRAQKEGYPARSVYKLEELGEKFGLLRLPGDGGTFRALDLGAAPGSWSLYILRKLGKRCLLTAADLSPLSRRYDRGLFDGENCRFIQGDMTAPEIREAILALGPFNLVMSDAAPATTGNRSVDALRSLELAEAALGYAETALVKGGNFIVKVFQGGETASALKRIRELFRAAKSCKPEACRGNSFETYYVGLGRKDALAQDPRTKS